MPRIRWEEEIGLYPDEHEWLGYIGKVVIATMIYDRYEEKWWLHFAKEDSRPYTKLSSAKRGAERLLDRFLREGEQQPSAKLDRYVVKTIKRMRDRGFSAHETARLACVNHSTIISIWKGETWKHI